MLLLLTSAVISFFVLTYCCLFFFNDPAPTEIYTLSLHDALPIWRYVSEEYFNPGLVRTFVNAPLLPLAATAAWVVLIASDRKSTRLNSSHTVISYAVFCLKKKKKTNRTNRNTSFT